MSGAIKQYSFDDFRSIGLKHFHAGLIASKVDFCYCVCVECANYVCMEFDVVCVGKNRTLLSRISHVVTCLPACIII